jgi:hypothetical protein
LLPAVSNDIATSNASYPRGWSANLTGTSSGHYIFVKFVLQSCKVRPHNRRFRSPSKRLEPTARGRPVVQQRRNRQIFEADAERFEQRDRGVIAVKARRGDDPMQRYQIVPPSG